MAIEGEPVELEVTIMLTRGWEIIVSGIIIGLRSGLIYFAVVTSRKYWRKN